MDRYIQISTTVAKKREAEKIAKALLKKGLAACVQISGPIASFYNWKGKMEKSEEYVCAIKTKKEKYKSVEKAIKALHPYDLPEIIILPIVGGSEKYLSWIDEEVIK